MSVSRSSSSSGGSTPELEEVNTQLGIVEAGLEALDKHKRSLHQHADNVKQDISSAVEHHMATLRAREKQLIRQVELVSTHQSCRLNVTQAQLLQHQGALAVTRTFLHRCQKGTDSTSGNSAKYCRETEQCCRQALQKCGEKLENSFAIYNLPSNDLQKETSGQPQGNVKLESRSCGAKAADCSDVCVYSSKKESSVDVASPGEGERSPSEDSVSHRDVHGLMRQAEKLLRVPFISVTKLDDPTLNRAIQNLGCVTLPPTGGHGELLPLPHCELLPHSELLPHCLEEYGDAEHHVLHKSVRPDSSEPIDVRQPYLVAARARRSFKKTSSPLQQTVAPQQPGLPGSDMATDKSEDLVKWLRRMQLDTPTRTPDLPPTCVSKEYTEVCVEEACQGNEACSSFSECFLNGQCQKNAAEKLGQSNKWRLQQQQHHQLRQETQASQVVQLHQNHLLSKLNKQVLEETNSNVQTRAESSGFVVPTNAARKRLFSDPTSAIQPVIAHMNAIQRSSNGSWLLMTGTNGVDSSIASLNLKNNKENNPRLSLAQDQWVNKKMRKDCEKDEVKTVGDITFRSAILYQAPAAQWSVNKGAVEDQKCHDEVNKLAKKLPESEDVVEEDDGESRTIKNDWLLKMCGMKSSPKKSALEKTMADNETNNVFLAQKIKSQLSMTNIESLKERIDKLSAQTERQPSEVTSTGSEQLSHDDKDDWLLKQSPAQQADNKILEEIMKKKSEWLSSSSRASFSVISESESRGSSWLLS